MTEAENEDAGFTVGGKRKGTMREEQKEKEMREKIVMR